MIREPEVIVAVASGSGVSAISLVRLSGSGVMDVVGRCCSISVADAGERSPREQRFCRILAEDGAVIDEVLLTVFPGPRSYTGEDVIELGCHGGRLVTRRVVERLMACGARAARAGEFTERAFTNGKMDLTQAEAVMDLIEAQTDLALRAAHGQLSGRFGEILSEARRELLGTLGHLEAHIDFPEEGLAPDESEKLAERVEVVGRALSNLASTAEMGRFLRDGVKTVICGEPNVGKSSLLNYLLGFDRAIVSETAGTTRDTIEEVIDIGGFPVRLIDTAGIRPSEDEIERAGIARTEEKIQMADFIIEVVDSSQEKGDWIGGTSTARRLRILNKSDLGEHMSWQGEKGLRVSCHTGDGLGGLVDAIAERLFETGMDSAQDSLVAVSARHRQCLDAAVQGLETVAEALRGGAELELVAIDLRGAMDSLGEIVGKVDSEELLGEIFGSFCVGK